MSDLSSIYLKNTNSWDLDSFLEQLDASEEKRAHTINKNHFLTNNAEPTSILYKHKTKNTIIFKH